MWDENQKQLVEQARHSFRFGDTRTAMECLQVLIAVDRAPGICSALGYCLAKEQKDYKEAIALCNEAIRKEPKEVRHFLLLGKVFLLAGRRREALRAFELGLRHKASPEIVAEMRKLGMRKPPPIPFLQRNNPLNKYLGMVLAGFGRR